MKTSHKCLLSSILIIGCTYNTIAAIYPDPIDDYKNASGVGGNKKTGKYIFGIDYGYLDVDKHCYLASDHVRVLDMNNKYSGGSPHKADCSTLPAISYDRKVNGGYASLHDAHFYANEVIYMFNDWADVTLFKDKLTVRVHYGDNYANAFYSNSVLTLGDGNDDFYPFTSIDVIGHALSHAFTEQNSNLEYAGEAGAINESFADITGLAAKTYLRRHSKDYKPNWMIGDTIVKAKNSGLRYFDDPTKDGTSVGHVNDYNNGNNVFEGAGIFNKAFYLLATKPNWDVQKGFDVFRTANQVYWSKKETFNSAACGVYRATRDLGYNSEDVVDAFAQVGVNATCK